MTQPLGVPTRLLVIDDEAIALENLVQIFEREPYQVVPCPTGTAALAALEREPFDVVLTDLRMPEVDGMRILQHARALWPDIQVILVTGYATLNSGIEAMKQGAYHYIAKPYRLDEVREVVRGAAEMARLKRENRELREQVASTTGQGTIVTQDLGMQRLLATARQIAPTDCNVVITGESGTGKELLARYLHRHSNRADSRFFGVNCGALHEDLLASELFGHEKGAFTGAMARKLGLIEAVSGGTLLLDEVAEMPMAMQVKLLRVIQERELLRVGGHEPVPVDVRLIAATNRPLEAAVATGRMREDLFFRLNVVNLGVPPLRERRDDVPLLAYYFLRRHAVTMGKEVDEIAPEAMRLLAGYDYPGNVRELSNFIERGVALATGRELLPTHLPEALTRLEVRVMHPIEAGGLPTLEAQEEQLIRAVLVRTCGNRTRAAEILGIDRVSLWRKIKRLGIDV
ncbi:sigma-54 dependent transcriptional regulator [Thioalkalicoccus limnaeus]|uniref:Sigma-54 dependent transcriptional regulator n=1 Tax=Thioalkalicoccus limnaeus TaxID=120681 RepID=A0ABV4BH09_9GAMM